MTANNARRVKRVIENVARLFGDRSIQPKIPTAFDFSPPADLETMSTGFRPLDKALDVGGLPCGKITELVAAGGTSLNGGATCIAARIASKVQRKQQIVAIIDLCHGFDPWQAERCGLAAPQLLLSRPATLFDALTTLENAARNAGLVIMVMGVAAELLSHAEPELLKTLLRRLRNIVAHSNSVFLLLTSPLKDDPFSPENYPVGFPLADLADVRLWIQEENWTHKDGVATAYKATLTVIKNRVALAGKGADIRIKFTTA
jgi:recombination protein RecA